MLKLLLISKDTSTFLNKNYFYLENELFKNTDLMIWRESGDIEYILKQVPKIPDFILIINDIGTEFYPIISGLPKTQIPFGLVVNDSHRFIAERKKYISQNNIKNFIVLSKQNFLKYYPEQRNKQIFFFPPFVNTEVYKDYNLDKNMDLMMLGDKVSPIYPLRKAIDRYYKSDPRYVSMPHPGWKNFTKEQEQNTLMGKNYAQFINRAKLFFTCGSVLQVLTYKYFEIPACKTLLLAPTFPELEQIGFVPGKHFVDINLQNFAAKAEYYLKNTVERNRITEEGFKFVQQYHSHIYRTEQLVKKMIEICNQQ
ncbi:glycosyltransferase [Fictibacillus phosphorivorans]|uniref:glycosyltransferase n=1 Tax=Fictibacillus phosphorivorans TaxID=1221500 RepID=UPI002041F9EE|nr:glycosyltransferase [Fictibacillus phosphorivorans]MCM3776765.1 glycosyltransferase [Fictibacillus phosphorivorans]